jgi:P-type Cu2+ transporter
VRLVGADDSAHGEIRLSDGMRGDAVATVAALRARGLRVVLLSGDHVEVAGHMARAAGIDEVAAAMSPEEKAEWVRQPAGGGTPRALRGRRAQRRARPRRRRRRRRHGQRRGQQRARRRRRHLQSSALAPVLAGLPRRARMPHHHPPNLRRSLIYNVARWAQRRGLVNPLVAALLMPLSSGLVIWGAFRVEQIVRAEEGGAQ